MDKAQATARIAEIEAEQKAINESWDGLVTARDDAQTALSDALARKRELSLEHVKVLKGLMNRRGEAR